MKGEKGRGRERQRKEGKKKQKRQGGKNEKERKGGENALMIFSRLRTSKVHLS